MLCPGEVAKLCIEEKYRIKSNRDFWWKKIEGNIASTSLNTLGDEIYIGSPRSFSGDAAIYKLGDGSSDWDYYDQHFSNLIPKMTMLLIMIDDQIPINCVGLQEPVL